MISNYSILLFSPCLLIIKLAYFRYPYEKKIVNIPLYTFQINEHGLIVSLTPNKVITLWKTAKFSQYPCKIE